MKRKLKFVFKDGTELVKEVGSEITNEMIARFNAGSCSYILCEDTPCPLLREDCSSFVKSCTVIEEPKDEFVFDGFFKIGDEVECLFLNGKHVLQGTGDLRRVKINHRGTDYLFFINGTFSPVHDKPLLKFIRRPKKKVKKTFEKYINVYEKCLGACVYDTEKEAIERGLENTDCGYIKTIKISETVEVEE